MSSDASPDMARARRAYRVLLRGYPRAQRQRDGHEMEEAFIALLRIDTERAGWAQPMGAAPGNGYKACGGADAYCGGFAVDGATFSGW